MDKIEEKKNVIYLERNRKHAQFMTLFGNKILRHNK